MTVSAMRVSICRQGANRFPFDDVRHIHEEGDFKFMGYLIPTDVRYNFGTFEKWELADFPV